MVGSILIESGHTGTITPNALIDVDGAFTMDGGTLDFTVNNTAMNVSGNFVKSGGTFSAGTNVVTLDGSLTLNVNSGTDLGDVTVSASPNNIVTIASDITMDDLIVGSGRHDCLPMDLN